MNLPHVPRAVRIAAFVAGCAVVAWLSLVPAEDLPPVGIADKVKHFAAYTALTGLGLWTFATGRMRLALGLLAFGVAIELLQAAMDVGRRNEAADVLANVLGIATALGLARLFARR
jgi:VanZ family protein